MHEEDSSKSFTLSSSLLSVHPSTLVMHCEQLLSLVLNKTAVLNNQPLTPVYIRQLLAKRNLTLRIPKTVAECVIELDGLINNINENQASDLKIEQNYGIQERSRSLFVFVFLIAFFSLISIIGNLCLAKVLYSKRFRLLQTDRIVLCLALSELCLVLIDSPTEIYRFLSFSFSQTWLCRFHTFFESLFSSCIIFYHLLGAFDRFVYIHGHTSSKISVWSKWCHRISTRSGSIILLILPVLCSFPIAICNLLHAYVIHTSLKMQICIVQYTHKILMSSLIFFYILPLLFSFFLHGKLIYFIRSKHHSHYLTVGSYMLPMTPRTTFDSQTTRQKRLSSKTILNNNAQILQPKTMNNKSQRVVTFNKDANRNAPETPVTTTTMTAAAQQVRTTNSSNSTLSSRSSNGICFSSVTSPIILYKVNSQANANAKRTVLLLVLLLSFYVLCWAPYNIYTWTHAYQLTTNIQNESFLERTFSNAFNETNSLLTDTLHADLRRIIFVNYSLYLLSMISMCFSFLFYFSLNKQARKELSHLIGCICPSLIFAQKKNPQANADLRHKLDKPRVLQYHRRYERNYLNKNHPLLHIDNNNNSQRIRTTKFKTHQTFSPQEVSIVNREANKKAVLNSPHFKIENQSNKRTVLTYGCHVQCCP